MPDMQNFSPFPNFRFYSSDNSGEEFGIVIVKATYEVGADGKLHIAEEQAPMVFTDKCHGEVNVSSLWHPSDMVPYKPRTDIIVNAVARAPNAQPAPSWKCGIQIERAGQILLSKRLLVSGARYWMPKWKRNLDDEQKRNWQHYRADFEQWVLTQPLAISELPLHYEYAYGGLLTRGPDENGVTTTDTNEFNPIGIGWLDPKWTDHTIPQRAPQIELAEDPILEPFKTYKPQGLGPIPCAWLPRRPLGGTYDQNWQDTIWPNWPPDYDFAYHNSAHPDLICDHLQGNETVQLLGFFADQNRVEFDLPGEHLNIDFIRADGSLLRQPMILDTLFLDIAEPDLREGRIFITWRVTFTANEFDKAMIWQASQGAPTEHFEEEFA